MSQSAIFLSRLNAVIVAVLFCAIVVALNRVADNTYARLDLTQDRVYTLSEVSKRTMAGLEDVLQVRYYISRGVLPPMPDFEHLEQEIADRLTEYQAFSGGKMRFEVVDPLEGRKEMSREVVDKLELEGVLASSEPVKRGDKAVPMEFFSSVRLTYADKTEVVNDVRSASNFEYEFTRAVRRMTITKIPTVGFYFSDKQSDLSPSGGFGTIAEQLRKDCLVRPVDLRKDDPVPADVDLLFVVAPENVSDRHKYEIDQFIMRGGKAVFMLDVFSPARMQGGRWGQPPVFMRVNSNLDDMLELYGVKPVPSMVFDMDDCGMGRRPKVVATKFGYVQKMETISYPPLIKTRKGNYDKGLSFVNQLDSIAFRHAHCLEPSSRIGADSPVKFTSLIKTSQRSWKVPFDFVFTEKPLEESVNAPEKCLAQYNAAGAQLTLAALLEGTFQSFYAEKEVPDPAKDEENPSEPGAPPKPEKEEPPKPKPQTVKKTALSNRIVVIADSDCLGDEIIGWPPNGQFFANLVDWLATGEDLSQIRAKAGRSRPLTVTETGKVWNQILMIGLMPVLVVFAGIGRSVVRRYAKE